MIMYPSLVIILLIVDLFHGCIAFWFIDQLKMASLVTTADHSQQATGCDELPGLPQSQKHMCQEQPEILASIGEGIKAGLAECQNQFKNYRWNCSAIEKEEYARSVVKAASSREGAFVQAISSAGVVYSITRGCSSGDIANCACDGSVTGALAADGAVEHDEKGNFTWLKNGCVDHVKFAIRFARRFVVMAEKERLDNDGESDERMTRSRALINLHNNRLGRKIIQDNLVKECKCHGVSGSCALRTCWMTVPPFPKTGGMLRERYEDAKEVEISHDGDEILVNEGNKIKPPKKSDMVFMDSSPDYCSSNSSIGTVGTAGRVCRLNSTGSDSCEIMCCGRGYDTRRVKVVERCRCKFQWCCEVKCEECEREVDEHVCKPEGSHRAQMEPRPRERRNRKGKRPTTPTAVSTTGLPPSTTTKSAVARSVPHVTVSARPQAAPVRRKLSKPAQRKNRTVQASGR